MIGYYFRNVLNEAFIQPFSVFWKLALFFAIVWILGFVLAGLYSFDLKRFSWEEFFGVILGSGAAITLISAAVFIFKEFDFSRLVLLITFFVGIVLAMLERLLAKILESFIYSQGLAQDRVLIVGPGNEAELVLKAFEKEESKNYKILGKCGFDDRFYKTVEKLEPTQIVVADSNLSRENQDAIFALCEEKGLTFRFVPDVFHSSPGAIISSSIDGLPLIELRATTLDGWTVVFKRMIDLFISFFGLLFLSPLLLLTVIIIRLDSSGSIFFPHERLGRNGKKFFLYKFRSMQMFEKDGKLVHAMEDTEIEKLKEAQPNYKLPEDPRITLVGSIIRRTSIDELPQLWNVLKGEMSIVGPRAYIEKELAVQKTKFPETEEQVRRLLTVKPGMTGLWQVSGRSNIDFSGRVAMEAHYATHANLLMDFRIMLKTIPAVLRGSGAM